MSLQTSFFAKSALSLPQAAFLNEASSSTSPISYELRSVWQVMANRDAADKTDQALQVMFDAIAAQSGWLFFPLH